jgi:hypothetical protein
MKFVCVACRQPNRFAGIAGLLTPWASFVPGGKFLKSGGIRHVQGERTGYKVGMSGRSLRVGAQTDPGAGRARARAKAAGPAGPAGSGVSFPSNGWKPPWRCSSGSGRRTQDVRVRRRCDHRKRRAVRSRSRPARFLGGVRRRASPRDGRSCGQDRSRRAASARRRPGRHHGGSARWRRPLRQEFRQVDYRRGRSRHVGRGHAARRPDSGVR